jgi:hypothetical protein
MQRKNSKGIAEGKRERVESSIGWYCRLKSLHVVVWKPRQLARFSISDESVRRLKMERSAANGRARVLV